MKPFNAFGPNSEDKPRKGQRPAKKQQRKSHTLQLICAVALVIVGSSLLVAGFFVPPVGEIHPSVLIAFGETLTFVGALFGIDYHYKSRNYGKV